MWDEVRRKGKEGSLSVVTGRMNNKGQRNRLSRDVSS
jgi:hypothetical protein